MSLDWQVVSLILVAAIAAKNRALETDRSPAFQRRKLAR
jgi:hypothetical protein